MTRPRKKGDKEESGRGGRGGGEKSGNPFRTIERKELTCL